MSDMLLVETTWTCPTCGASHDLKARLEIQSVEAGEVKTLFREATLIRTDGKTHNKCCMREALKQLNETEDGGSQQGG